jgi:hypothetical protein
VVAICELFRKDQPQRLRLAAQLVSRSAVNVDRLILLARRERTDVVLGEQFHLGFFNPILQNLKRMHCRIEKKIVAKSKRKLLQNRN